MQIGAVFGWISGGSGGGGGGGVNAKYAVATGIDTYAATFTGLTTLSAGQVFYALFQHANTGPSTLNPNSLGAIPMLKFGDTPLRANDIKDNQVLEMLFDGTNLQILSVTDNILVAP